MSATPTKAIRTLFILTGLGLAPVPAAAFEFVAPIPPGADVEVINGAEPTDPGTWPATFIFRSGTGGCTSTVIGSRVVLTAAHCVPNGATGTIKVGTESVPVRCDHHPTYGGGNRTTDFALCLTQTEIAGLLFEVVSSSIAYPRVNDSVVLLGYGCTQQGGHDAGFSVLFFGDANVVRTPNGTDIDTITKGGAALCYGDSGGAAYFNLVPNGARRAIIGVNSRGDISEYSFLSSTATPQFVNWAFDWSAQNGVMICGMHTGARGCR